MRMNPKNLKFDEIVVVAMGSEARRCAKKSVSIIPKFPTGYGPFFLSDYKNMQI